MTQGRDLLEWYDRFRRDLPWRVDTDPYRVLVSEIMLQQTRVETVLRYYDRFVDRFPDVESLAAADIEDVLPLWSGLGYYSRARRLHAAAGAVVERGSFPETSTELLDLPGIGAYTAAAVASIAFEERIAVLDGNVERVISRLIALEVDPKKKAGREQIYTVAESLLVEGRPGDSNQAMMELGATLCRPRMAQCLVCPLAPSCQARKLGDPRKYPLTRKRRAVEKRYRLSLVVRESQRLLLVKRREDEGWMPGLFELPSLDVEERQAALLACSAVAPGAESILRELTSRFEERYGGEWTIGDDRSRVRHGITHHSFVIEVRSASVRFARGLVNESGRESESSSLYWTPIDRLSDVATTSMVEKSIGALDLS